MKKLLLLVLGFSTLVAFTVFATEKHTVAQGVDTFEKLFGVTKGKRRNHTKGFCFEATLSPTKSDIQRFSQSALFTKNFSVTGRLSHKGGNINASDVDPAQYGMALLINTALNEQHIMSMNTLDFFPVATPEAFAKLMRAKVSGAAAVQAFKQKNTHLQKFKAHYAKKSQQLVPYEDSQFNSINSFYLVNKEGHKSAVRWSFIPQKKTGIAITPAHTFFLENLKAKLKDQNIVWDMVIEFANEGDAIHNAAIPWTGKHKTITAATLTINNVQPEQVGKCENINFDPLVLSKGFSPSNDPLLQARRNAYAVAFSRRTKEINEK